MLFLLPIFPILFCACFFLVHRSPAEQDTTRDGALVERGARGGPYWWQPGSTPHSVNDQEAQGQQNSSADDQLKRQGSFDSLRSSSQYHEDRRDRKTACTKNEPLEAGHVGRFEVVAASSLAVSGTRAPLRPVPPLSLAGQRLPTNLPMVEQSGMGSGGSSPTGFLRQSVPLNASSRESAYGGHSITRSPKAESASDLRGHDKGCASPAEARREGFMGPTPPSKPSSFRMPFHVQRRGDTDSDQSSTLGLADLPPPPPPSRSPNDDGLLARMPRRPPERPTAFHEGIGMSAPPQGGYHPLFSTSRSDSNKVDGPTPISKDSRDDPPPPGQASSVGSYPTLTPTPAASQHSDVSGVASAPVGGNERLHRFFKFGQGGRRPGSARPDGDGRLQRQSVSSDHPGAPLSPSDTHSSAPGFKWFGKGRRPGTAGSTASAQQRGESGRGTCYPFSTTEMHGSAARDDGASVSESDSGRFIVFSVNKVTSASQPTGGDSTGSGKQSRPDWSHHSSPLSSGAVNRRREETLGRLHGRTRLTSFTSTTKLEISQHSSRAGRRPRGDGDSDTEATMSAFARYGRVFDRTETSNSATAGSVEPRGSMDVPRLWGKRKDSDPLVTQHSANKCGGRTSLETLNQTPPSSGPSSKGTSWLRWKKERDRARASARDAEQKIVQAETSPQSSPSSNVSTVSQTMLSSEPERGSITAHGNEVHETMVSSLSESLWNSRDQHSSLSTTQSDMREELATQDSTSVSSQQRPNLHRLPSSRTFPRPAPEDPEPRGPPRGSAHKQAQCTDNIQQPHSSRFYTSKSSSSSTPSFPKFI